MSNKKRQGAVARLNLEIGRLKKEPVQYIFVEPLPTNILELHYVIIGPEDTPYAGGIYHGRLMFSPEYPFKPPSIFMITPNGRFTTNTRLCLTMSDYHPELWNPAWSISTILTGLLSFMTGSESTTGSTSASEAQRKNYATASLSYNLRDKLFCQLFPDIVKKIDAELEKRKEEGKGDGDQKSGGWLQGWFS